MAKMKAKQKQEVRPVDYRSIAKELVRTINESWFDFSIIAYKIDKDGLWSEWGYNTIKEYAEQELGIEYRTFRYRVVMGEAIQRFGITKEQVAELGWSKFKELSTLFLAKQDVDPEDIAETIEDAKALSFREIKDFVRTTRSTYEGEPVTTKVTMKFTLVDESATVVTEALNRAIQLIGIESQNSALEYICADWLTMNQKTPNIKLVTEVKNWEEQRKQKVGGKKDDGDNGWEEELEQI